MNLAMVNASKGDSGPIQSLQSGERKQAAYTSVQFYEFQNV